jgi:hypothetical protein
VQNTVKEQMDLAWCSIPDIKEYNTATKTCFTEAIPDIKSLWKTNLYLISENTMVLNMVKAIGSLYTDPYQYFLMK